MNKNFCSFIAIIPARSGSKGIKNKNLKKINGIPLINYTIEAAKRSKFIKKIFVSLGFDIIQNGYFNLPKRRFLVIEKLELLLNKIPILRNWLFKSQYLVAKKNPESPLLKRLNLFETV